MLLSWVSQAILFTTLYYIYYTIVLIWFDIKCYIIIYFFMHVHKHTNTERTHTEREQEGEKREWEGGGSEREGRERGERGGNQGRKGVFVSVGIIVFLLICVPRLRGPARRCCENCENKNNSHLEINKRGYGQGPGHSTSSSFTQQASLNSTNQFSSSPAVAFKPKEIQNSCTEYNLKLEPF